MFTWTLLVFACLINLKPPLPLPSCRRPKYFSFMSSRLISSPLALPPPIHQPSSSQISNNQVSEKTFKGSFRPHNKRNLCDLLQPYSPAYSLQGSRSPAMFHTHAKLFQGLEPSMPCLAFTPLHALSLSSTLHPGTSYIMCPSRLFSIHLLPVASSSLI